MLLKEVGDEGGHVGYHVDNDVKVVLQALGDSVVYMLDGWLDLRIVMSVYSHLFIYFEQQYLYHDYKMFTCFS